MRALAQTRHPSSVQRKEALNMLKNQLWRSQLEPTMLTPVVKAVVPLMTDETPAVRTALRQLLQSMFSEKEASAEPHTLFIVLYIHSGMTHVLPEVRDDTTRVLQWLLEIQGECVVRRW